MLFCRAFILMLLIPVLIPQEAVSTTSDFFILLNDQPSLDFGGLRFDDGQGAAAFGYVSPDSMETVRKIQQQPVEGQNLKPPIAILSATRTWP